MLIVYSLIGRHTMTDLQEDRLVRNLLGQGIDLWDWGNATRADRWLTIDDYVSGYLADCVSAMCRATAPRRSTCSASAKAASSTSPTRH